MEQFYYVHCDFKKFETTDIYNLLRKINLKKMPDSNFLVLL